MAWISPTKVCNRVTKSTEQDQTARMCRLILFFFLQKINASSRTAELKGLKGNFSNFTSLLSVKSYVAWWLNAGHVTWGTPAQALLITPSIFWGLPSANAVLRAPV